MNTYHDYIKQYETLLHTAEKINITAPQPPQRLPLTPNAPCVLLFAPHPDDESIIGALPLRLRKESGCRIINVAVTQGSLKSRRAERRCELENACRYLGFELIHPLETGLENITPDAHKESSVDWINATACIKSIIDQYQPAVIILPHDNDWNSTHVGTHCLVVDALSKSSLTQCQLFETEYWHPMEQPAVMIESSTDDVAELVTAVSRHTGEICRTPYHLALPSWMHDNVRRGTELLSGQGSGAPGFHFATLYGMKNWDNGTLTSAKPAFPFVSKNDTISTLLLNPH